MNRSTPEHRRDILGDVGKRHDRVWILLGGMGEPFEGGKGFLIGESQDW